MPQLRGGGSPSKSDIQQAGPEIKKEIEDNPATKKIVEQAEKLGIKEKEIQQKIWEITTSITTTKDNLPSKFDGIKDKLAKGEFLSIFSDLWTLVSYIVNLIFNQWKDAKGDVIKWALDIKKLDFNTFDLAQLGGNIGDSTFPKIEDSWTQQGWSAWKKLEEPERGKNSLIARLSEKANSGDIIDQVMYTSALSKAKDMYYAKFKKWKDAGGSLTDINPKLTEEEVKKFNEKGSSYEDLERNTQPWDMVFFIAGDWAKQEWYDSALALSSTLPIYHVGLVGEWWYFYHSTMKEYGKGYAGAHKVKFQDELNSRKPCKVLVVRPNTDTSKMLSEAQSMVDAEMKYSQMDAITALGKFWNIDGKNKVNCWDFVNNALQVSWITGIKNAGAPSKIIEEGQEKWLWFTNQYLWNFS